MSKERARIFLRLVEELNVSNIVIAIPSLTKARNAKDFRRMRKTKVKTKIIPMIEDLITGKISVSHLRDVQVEDLLGREPIELDTELNFE